MVLRQFNRAVDHSSIYLKKDIVFGTVLEETAQDMIPLFFRYASRRAVLCRQGSGKFGKSDFSE